MRDKSIYKMVGDPDLREPRSDVIRVLRDAEQIKDLRIADFLRQHCTYLPAKGLIIQHTFCAARHHSTYDPRSYTV